MNKNDAEFKKIARNIGISLLSFVLMFYFVLTVFYAVFEDIINQIFSPIVSKIVFEGLYGILYAATFVVPALIYMILSRKQKKEMPVKFPISPSTTVFTVSLAIAIIFSAAYINNLLASVFDISDSLTTSDEVSSFIDFLLLTFTMAIVPAFCEEFLFRKTIIKALLPYGEGLAILSSAVMFGMMHQNIFQIFYATMAGIVLGYVYSKTRSFLCVFLIHFTNNFLSVIQQTLVDNLGEPYDVFAGALLTGTVLLLGVISLIFLIKKEYNQKNAYSTGSFEMILRPSANYFKKKTSFNCAKKLFLSPCVLIFIILCALMCVAMIVI